MLYDKAFHGSVLNLEKGLSLYCSRMMYKIQFVSSRRSFPSLIIFVPFPGFLTSIPSKLHLKIRKQPLLTATGTHIRNYKQNYPVAGNPLEFGLSKGSASATSSAKDYIPATRSKSPDAKSPAANFHTVPF